MLAPSSVAGGLGQKNIGFQVTKTDGYHRIGTTSERQYDLSLVVGFGLVASASSPRMDCWPNAQILAKKSDCTEGKSAGARNQSRVDFLGLVSEEKNT